MYGPCFSSIVGGHPLRPPTRLRLGRPLPYQLADGPQTPPEVNFSFTLASLTHKSLCGISSPFELLSPASGQIIHVLLTRSPLTLQSKSPRPSDLHVLGTPPAFILSQDQTLHIFHHSLRVCQVRPFVFCFPSRKLAFFSKVSLGIRLLSVFSCQGSVCQCAPEIKTRFSFLSAGFIPPLFWTFIVRPVVCDHCCHHVHMLSLTCKIGFYLIIESCQVVSRYFAGQSWELGIFKVRTLVDFADVAPKKYLSPYAIDPNSG